MQAEGKKWLEPILKEIGACFFKCLFDAAILLDDKPPAILGDEKLPATLGDEKLPYHPRR